MTAPTPTTSTHTRKSGDTVHVTEWTIGAYKLRKTEEPGYIGWEVTTADRTRPHIEDIAWFGQSPEFGVSCSSIAHLSTAGAVAYADQIVEAAEIASKFNEIIAAN